MIIRDAKISDMTAITAMWRDMMEEIQIPGKSFDETEQGKFADTLYNVILSKNGQVLVAEEDGPVGFMMNTIGRVRYGYEGLIGQFEHIWVSPEYRNSEAFFRMRDIGRKWVRDKGARRVEFRVRPEKVKAYEAMGFKPASVVMVGEP